MTTATSKTGIRTIAVENFLGTLDGLTRYEAMQNLKLDAQCYKWNSDTVRAIAAGINKHYAKKSGYLSYL